jgi:ribonuclease HII
MDLFEFDEVVRKRGFNLVAGIDEVGRGALAGPVVAAAVIFKADAYIDGLRDSKKLSPQQRLDLIPKIYKNVIAFCINGQSHKVVDKLNIFNASLLAMEKAIEGLSIKPDICLIDGNKKIEGLKIPQETIVAGDNKSAAVAAASVIAKVWRDAIMENYAKQFPPYLFEKNKGYSTRQHLSALKQYGACPIHRQSFAPIFVFTDSELNKITLN